MDGDLEPGEALRLARHLTACTACRIVLARESRLAAVLDGMGDAVSVDVSFFEAVMASLPERPLWRGADISGMARWRRGLRLAALGSIVAMGAGLAARVLPPLPLSVATPAAPRFTPNETEGWISFLGTAAQWIRMNAQSSAWAGSPEAWSSLTIGAFSVGAALAGAVMLVAVSGALAWATRTGSRAS